MNCNLKHNTHSMVEKENKTINFLWHGKIKDGQKEKMVTNTKKYNKERQAKQARLKWRGKMDLKRDFNAHKGV